MTAGDASSRGVDAGLLGLLACPDCGTPIAEGDGVTCSGCSRPLDLGGGAFPRLLAGGGASNADVQDFYEEQPFPDYEDLDSPRALAERARRSGFAGLLDRELPLGGFTLEAGCGTGQLSNFLALSQRRMVGLDFCGASLRLASGFRDDFGIGCADFVQGDLFHLPFRDACFDNIVTLGVLHHTADPAGAFRGLVRLLKPGGHILVGLYNRYGRIPTKLRGYLIRAFGLGFGARLDPVARTDRKSERRRRSWVRDQYFHPLEKTHTVDEVLGWFRAANIDYVNAVPKIVFGERYDREGELFAPGIEGSPFGHVACQLGWAFSHGWEGGLFVLIGRKPAE